MKHSELSDEARFRANARAYANTYLRRGKLQRKPCERCGSDSAEMHHDDYSRPLDVRWLCRSCHVDAHGGSTKAPSYRSGSCAKCEAPKAPGCGYCPEHRAEYMRGWRKKERDRIQAMEKIVGTRVEPA
jgi:ribosomal protein S27AE